MNYSLAASFAAAAKEAIAELDHEAARLGALKDQMEALVMEAVPSAIITALGANRAAYNAHFIFPGTQSDAMLFFGWIKKGVCVSEGSACQAGVLGPSHVLLGMGFSQS
jgi:cysteine desulfurase